MSHYLFDGKLSKISEVQLFANNFKKLEFVVISEDEHKPQEIKFEFVGEQVEAMKPYKVGESVTVAFLLMGNEYNGKHYVNLRAIAIGERISDNHELRNVDNGGKIKRRVIEETKNNIIDDGETLNF